MTNDLEELKRLAEAAGAGEWRYRPGELDDWGDVRDARGFRICQARDPRYIGDGVLNEARRAGVDPWQGPARFIAAANPAAILSLIERVREAENLRDVVSMYDREERAAIAAIPQHFLLELPDGGNVKLHEGITRFARAEYARGRAEALEEAAKVADSEKGKGDTSEEFDDGWNGAAMLIATAIRALKSNT